VAPRIGTDLGNSIKTELTRFAFFAETVSIKLEQQHSKGPVNVNLGWRKMGMGHICFHTAENMENYDIIR